MKEQAIPLAPLRVPRDFHPVDGEIADTLQDRGWFPPLECRGHPFEDELIGTADVRQIRMPRKRQHERIRQAAGALQHGAAAAAAPEYWNAILLAGGDMDVVDEPARWPQHHKMAVAFPKTQDRIIAALVQFIQQGVVQGEILYRGRQSQIE